jgi:predicted RNase H-like HicB family nuclease
VASVLGKEMRFPALADGGRAGQREGVKGEFTAVIEAADEGGFRAYCPEVPGANGQGETVAEAKAELAAAIQLVLEDRLEDSPRSEDLPLPLSRFSTASRIIIH